MKGCSVLYVHLREAETGNPSLHHMSDTPKNISDPSSEVIGIIAGGGPLPIVVAEAVTGSDRSVFICALKGFADPALEKFPHDWVTLGSVGRIIKQFKSANCQKIVMIGHVKRPDKSQFVPDFGALKNAGALLKIARGGDNQLLSGVASFIETQGFSVIGAHELIPENLIGENATGKCSHTEEVEEDIIKGIDILNALGKLDVGQAVVVHGGHVLAVEAAEGTDEMLRRVADLRKNGRARQKGGILLKGPKPNQDLRVDMPVIGPVTVELVAEAALSGIVVQANSVLCHDRPALIQRARDLGIFIESRTFLH